MKSHIDKTVKVTLLLDKEEAQWLKDLMQNPLGRPDNPSALLMDESTIDSDMRHRFFDAVKGVDDR